jgi:hypothetical protein
MRTCWLALIPLIAFAQTTPPVRPQRPALFWSEAWKQTMETPLTQEFVSNPALELKLYGPSATDMRVTSEGNSPPHTFSGMCMQTCAVALRHRESNADLRGLAKMRWATKVSGFHLVRPIIKLADGEWYVGNHAEGQEFDWHESEFYFSELRWQRLHIDRITPFGGYAEGVDLSAVEEIGFTDMMPGGLHGTERGRQSPTAWSDVARIEIYASPVKRAVKP